MGKDYRKHTNQQLRNVCVAYSGKDICPICGNPMEEGEEVCDLCANVENADEDD